MDTIFCDSLEFTIPSVHLTNRPFVAVEDKVRFACEMVGIELMNYDTAMIIPKPDANSDARVYGKTWIRKQQ